MIYGVLLAVMAVIALVVAGSARPTHRAPVPIRVRDRR